jgi:hypothetical protein
VRDAIRTAAQENQDFIGDRASSPTARSWTLPPTSAWSAPRSWTFIGMVGAEVMLKQRLTGQAFNAEQITAARKLLIQSATETSAAMKKASSGTDRMGCLGLKTVANTPHETDCDCAEIHIDCAEIHLHPNGSWPMRRFWR